MQETYSQLVNSWYCISADRLSSSRREHTIGGETETSAVHIDRAHVVRSGRSRRSRLLTSAVNSKPHPGLWVGIWG